MQAEAAQMMSDVARAPARIQLSSNPYDYVAVSPAFKRIVALGKPAVSVLVSEIRTSKDNGLREYLLAIAGSQILREPTSKKHWSTAKEWAAQHR